MKVINEQNLHIMIDYTITDDNLHIPDSHKVSKFKMMGILKQIKKDHPESHVFDRCLSSLYLEWICHNFLYEIGYERERTKDTDLDNPCDQPEWEYIVGGMLVWPFTFKTK